MLANKQFYVSVGILSVVTVGLFLGVVLPSTFAVREIREDIDGEHIKIQERYHERGQLKETLLNLREIKSSVTALTSVAVKEGRELEFVQALEAAAGRHTIEQDIQLKTVNQIELSDWEMTVPITITAEGDFVDLLNYLRDLESLTYYINIDSFVFGSTRTKGAKKITDEPVRATMNGSVYWINDSIPKIIDSESI